MTNFGEMDISKKAEEGAWLELTGPSGEVLDARVLLIGKDAKVYRSKMRNISQQDRNKKKGLAIKDLEKMSLDTYVSATLNWENIMINESEGNLECTRENKMRFYNQFPWVLEQVSEFVEDRSNFL